MSNGAGELRNSLLRGQLPKSFQLLNDAYDEREVFRSIILSVQVVVISHTQTGNYFHVFTALFKFLRPGLLVNEVCKWPKEGGGGFFVNSKKLQFQMYCQRNKTLSWLQTKFRLRLTLILLMLFNQLLLIVTFTNTTTITKSCLNYRFEVFKETSLLCEFV